MPGACRRTNATAPASDEQHDRHGDEHPAAANAADRDSASGVMLARPSLARRPAARSARRSPRWTSRRRRSCSSACARCPPRAPLLDRLADAPACTWSAARYATCCSADSRSSSISSSRATPPRSPRGSAAGVRVHDRFGTATVSARRLHLRHRPRPHARPTRTPARCPDVSRRAADRGSAAARLHRQRARDRARRPERRATLHAAPGRARGSRARGRLRVLHDAASSTIRPGCCGSPATRAGSGFEVEPQTRELAGRGVDGGALATVSGPRIGAELRLLAREPDPVGALDGARASSGSTRAIHPGFGLDDPELARGARSSCCPPTAAATCSRSRSRPRTCRPPSSRGLLDTAGVRGRGRDSDRRRGDAAPSASPSAGARASGRPRSPPRSAGAGPELVALAGALGPERAAREWLERLRHVRLEIDGDDLLAAGVPEGPAVGRGLRRRSRRSSTARVAAARPSSPGPAGGAGQRIACSRMLAAPNALRWDGDARPLRGLLPHAHRPATGVGIWIRYTMLAPLEPRRAGDVRAVVPGHGSAAGDAHDRAQGDVPDRPSCAPRPIRSSCGSATRR